MSSEIFDTHSSSFTKGIDDSIASGRYERGRLFVEAIEGFVKRGETVLDYGCGPGRIGRMLVERGYAIDGCDPSPAMIGAATAMECDPDKARFWLADDNGASLETGRYGGIVCSSVVEFVERPEQLLANLHRALKPGGTLAISFSKRNSLWRAYVKWRRRDQQPHFSVQFNSWTFKEARGTLEAAGFHVVAGPVYFEVAPFQKRPILMPLAGLSCMGTLGLITAVRD